MARSIYLAEMAVVFVLTVACGGSATNDSSDTSSSGGGAMETGGAGTGAASNGGASGGSGGGIIVGAGGYPSNPLTDDCTPTPEATDYGRSRAQESCSAIELLYTEGRDATGDFGFPTFPQGMGGAGSAGTQPLEACPLASELEWSCRVSEGTTCAFPQCEEPTTAAPVDGECCYAVLRMSGV